MEVLGTVEKESWKFKSRDRVGFGAGDASSTGPYKGTVGHPSFDRQSEKQTRETKTVLAKMKPLAGM